MAEKTRVRSSIDALPDAEREMLNGWLADVNTSYEEIADRMEKRGYKISRSAIGRYAIRINKASERLRKAREQVNALIASMRDNQDVEAGEVASALLLDGLLGRIAIADDEYDEMPIQDVIDSVAKLQRTSVYKARMSKDRSRVIKSVEANLLARLQIELPERDPELLERLQAIVADVGREEAQRDVQSDG